MCTYQSCGKKYKIDLYVPNSLWEKIKPKGAKPGGGLLCGRCIMDRLEKILDYSAFRLTDTDLE